MENILIWFIFLTHFFVLSQILYKQPLDVYKQELKTIIADK